MIASNATNVLAASGYTTGYADNNSEDCGAAVGTVGVGAPDRVFSLTPAATGMMTVTVGNELGNTQPYCEASDNMATVNCWEYALYARSACADASATALLACSQPATDAASIAFPVTANTPYYVIVDGLTNDDLSYGFFNLYVSLQ